MSFDWFCCLWLFEARLRLWGGFPIEIKTELLFYCFLNFHTIYERQGCGRGRGYVTYFKVGDILYALGIMPLALCMSIYSIFQINGALGETRKPPDPYFASEIWCLDVSEFLPKLHLLGNYYKSAYLEPRTISKSPQFRSRRTSPSHAHNGCSLGSFIAYRWKPVKTF